MQHWPLRNGLSKMLTQNEIKNIIPHREPFLLLDEVTELEPGIRGRGLLEIGPTQVWLEGHFPDYPVFPGVLLTEALAQLGSVVVLSQKDLQGYIPLFAGLDQVKFRRQVRPGDIVDLHIEIIRAKKTFGVGRGRATVNGKTVVEGKLKFALLAGGDLD